MKRIWQAFIEKTQKPQPTNRGTAQLSITPEVVDQIKNSALQDIDITLQIKKIHLAILQVQKNLEEISEKEKTLAKSCSDFRYNILDVPDFFPKASSMIREMSNELLNAKTTLMAAQTDLKKFKEAHPEMPQATTELNELLRSVCENFVIITQTYGTQQKMVMEMAQQGLIHSAEVRATLRP